MRGLALRTMNSIVVDEFRFDLDTQTLHAPRDYFEAQGAALLQNIVAGDDLIFNIIVRTAPTPLDAVLLRLSGDYEGWLQANTQLGAFVCEPQTEVSTRHCECCAAHTFTPAPRGECTRCGHEHLEHG